MNGILMIYMFMIGCEVPAGILSYQYVNFSSSKEVYVPDCRGLEEQEAISKLSKLSLDTQIINLPYSPSYTPGTVSHMVPNPFIKIKTNRVVTLSIAGHKKLVKVPNLEKMSVRNAKIKIANSGFALDSIFYDYSAVINEGLIGKQVPEHGAMRISGSSLSIHVSRGHPSYYYKIPDLVNLPFKKAKEKILEEGFRVGEIIKIYKPNLIPDTVIDQSFPANLKLTVPVEINLDISTDRE
jgi:serine/threonine-protein kinase